MVLRLPAADVCDFIAGGGEMGERTREFDWCATPLGPPSRWPHSLRTALRIMLGSRYPMFVWWGREELIYFYNDAYIPVLGQRHPEALGRSARQVWREIWDTIGPQADVVLNEGRATWNEELPLVITRNGYLEEVYFTFSYSPVPDDEGGVGGVFCACTEDTQRVLGQRRLRTLRMLGERATEAKSVAAACEVAAAALNDDPNDLPFCLLYLLDRDGKTATLSGVVGVERGASAAPAVVDLQDPNAPWPLQRVLESKDAVDVVDLSSRFGALPGRVWPESPQRALVLPMGKSGQAHPTGFVVAGISPRLPFDDDYKGYLALVAGQIGAAVASAHAYEAEKERAEALAQIDRAKTAFFSNVSHEFRTPLTLILGPLEESLAEAPGGRERERLDLMRRNALRLQKLVNTLLDFSRFEAGRMRAVYEATDLAGLTSDLASAFRSAIESAGMRLIVDCPPLPSSIHVDRDMWEKIVLNLLSNAFKFTLEGEIEVRLRDAGDRVELTVRDTGSGIPHEQLPHVFERFHRVEGTRARTHEGTGIGLALVRDLVELHGGRVRLESAPGRGSTFFVDVPKGTAHLPREQVGSDRDVRPSASALHHHVNEALGWVSGAAVRAPSDSDPGAATRPEPAASPRARIVWADDNTDMRGYVARLLEPLYDVQAVPDGEAAVEIARGDGVDLVLVDVMMPRLDGFGVLRALRNDERTRTLPIILLSARAGEEARVDGLEAGADDYLVKPFGARELLARVEAAIKLGRVRREAEQALRAAMSTLRSTERQLEAELKDATLLQRLSAELVREEEVDELYDKLLDAAVAIMRSDFASMQRLHPERGARGELRLLAFRGFHPDAARVWERVRADSKCVCGLALDAGERVVVPDVEENQALAGTDHLEAYLRTGIHAVQSTPLVSRSGAVVGMLSTHWRARHEPSERDLRLLDIVARQAADIIERKAAAEALRHRTVKLEMLVARAPIGIFLVDADFCVRQVNPIAMPRFEGVVGGVIGRDFAEVARILRGEEHAGEMVRIFRHALETGESHVSDEEESVREDLGTTEYHEWRVDRIQLADGRHGLVCYFRDISQHVRARLKIAESEQRFRSLVSVITDVSWTAAAAGGFETLQPAWAAYTGQPWDTHRGLGWIEAVHPDDRAAVVVSLERARESRSLWEWSARLWHAASRQHRHVVARATPMLEQDGGVREWVGSCTDVHEQRRAEEALKQADRRKDEFLATLAHELRNPLAPIRNALQILRMAGRDPGTAERVQDMMERQVHQMVRLVDDLMEISRITRGKIELRREPVEVADIVRSAVETSRPLFEASEHELVVSVPPEPLTLDADPVRVAQVLSNLLNNAAKYTERGGKVWLTASKEGAEVVLSVRDTGAGIPVEMLPRVFDLFTQVERTYDRAQGGLGIGLTLVRSLVDMHGGTVEARSDGPGRGSEFVVRLPAAHDQLAARDDARRLHRPAALPHRILVVDDNFDAADSLGMLLKFLGADVHTAHDGVAALEALRSYRPSVVLLDIGMPGMDGYEVARRARAAHGAPDLTLVALTGWGQEEDRRRSREAGIDHHLVKPVDVDALQALLASLPSRGARPDTDASGV